MKVDQEMKQAYRLFRRNNGVYFIENTRTRKQASLRTRDEREANRLLNARNEAAQNSGSINKKLARSYLSESDPAMLTRTWGDVFDEVNTAKKEDTRNRQERACLRPQFNAIRDQRLLETTRQDILALLPSLGAYARNIFRVYYNYARDMDYMTENVLPRPLWPRPKPTKKRRAITREEHLRIVDAEQNTEHRRYYLLAWELGAAQTDLATMQAENIHWQNHTLSYYRRKTKNMATISIGPTLEALLRQLPAQGPLFPKLSRITSQARSAEFCRRCRVLKIKGVSLHSYRYAWAQRAKEAGYPERWAKAHLGHKSSAVHEHYASGDEVVITSLEDFQAKVLPFERAQQEIAHAG